MKKILRILLVALIYLVNLTAFQNCSKLQSSENSSSKNQNNILAGNPEIQNEDCNNIKNISLSMGDLVIDLNSNIHQDKSLDLSFDFDSKKLSWTRVVPNGKKIKLKISQIYQSDQQIKVSIDKINSTGKTMSCAENSKKGSLSIPSQQAFQIERIGTSQVDFPASLVWENKRLYATFTKANPPSNVNRYFAVDQRFLSTSTNNSVNKLEKFPMPLNYPIHFNMSDNEGGMNSWNVTGEYGNKYSREYTAIYLVSDPSYKGWRPLDNKVKYCENTETTTLPGNKFFGLDSVTSDCTLNDLVRSGFTGIPKHIESPDKNMWTMTPNTMPYDNIDNDKLVREMSDQSIIDLGNQFKNKSVVMFDFEHNQKEYSAKGTGNKFALLADTITKSNPKILVWDWWQGALTDELKSMNDIEKAVPFLKQKNLKENSIFYSGITGLNKWIGDRKVKINSEYVARYPSVGNKRYIDTVSATQLGAYAPQITGTLDQNNQPEDTFIPDIIYGSRIVKAYFPDKKAMCSGWWQIEPMARAPYTIWSMEAPDGDHYETQGRNTYSASMAREASLWCLLEGDGYYGWDGQSKLGFGSAKPSMYNAVYNFRYFNNTDKKWRFYDNISQKFNGQDIDPETGFPGTGWLLVTQDNTNYRNMISLHQQDYTLKGVSEVSDYKIFIEQGQKIDLAASLNKSDVESAQVDPDGNQIIYSTKYQKPFAIGFVLPSGQTLVAVRMNSQDFNVQKEVYVKVGQNIVKIPTFGFSTSLQIVGK